MYFDAINIYGSECHRVPPKKKVILFLNKMSGSGRFRPATGLVASPAYHGSSSAYYHQPTGQYTFPYSAYG